MNEQIKIQVNAGNILVLKTDMLLRPDHLNAIQKSIANQLKEGAVIIPNGFSYEILNPAQIHDEITYVENHYKKNKAALQKIQEERK